MEELRECPFCGGKAQQSYAGAKHIIICPNCVKLPADGGYIDSKDAITAWNTRHDNWISVDTMPDRCGMSVLLVGVNRYEQTRVFQGFTGYMETGRLLFYSNIGDVDINNWDVTHWMPLPEPPKGDGN